MTLQAFGLVVALAAVAGIAVGALGLGALYLLRRRSIGVQIVLVSMIGVLAVVAGIVWVSAAMYVSGHDLVVALTVSGVAGVVAVGVAAVLGTVLVRSSRRLQSAVAAMGAGVPVDAAAASGAEFRRVAEELARTDARLQEARDEVAAMDRSRRELIAWISHDLRTPLAGLRAMSEALEDGIGAPPEIVHPRMRGQIDRLAAMVDDLFELSRIQSGALQVAAAPLSLSDLIDDVVGGLAPVAEARGIALRVRVPPTAQVTGDDRLLARMLGNLVVNAIQHTPTGGSVAVAVEQVDAHRARISVTDTGSGIPEADLARVFEAGWRGEPSRTPEPLVGRTAGAGFGLAIAQGIAAAHAGSISAVNVAGGSRFAVDLPLLAG